MKRVRHPLAAALAGFAVAGSIHPAAVEAGPLPPGFTSTPGQIFYNYASPTVNIHAGIQLGRSVSTSVNQNSVYNVSGVVQVGNRTKAGIVQAGSFNNSTISQYGHINTATVLQFGPSASMLGY